MMDGPRRESGEKRDGIKKNRFVDENYHLFGIVRNNLTTTPR